MTHFNHESIKPSNTCLQVREWIISIAWRQMSVIAIYPLFCSSLCGNAWWKNSTRPQWPDLWIKNGRGLQIWPDLYGTDQTDLNTLCLLYPWINSYCMASEDSEHSFLVCLIAIVVWKELHKGSSPCSTGKIAWRWVNNDTNFNDHLALREMFTADYELKEKTLSLPPVCHHIPLFNNPPSLSGDFPSILL